MNLTKPLVLNVMETPDKTCIICENRQYSFFEFNNEVNRMANGLIERGIQKGEHVSVFMQNSDYFAIAAYAIWKIGAVLVPINFRLAPPELRYIVEQSESVLLFCDVELEAISKEALADATILKHTIVQPAPATNTEKNSSWSDNLSLKMNEPSVTVGAQDNAEILYTSGTTGQPKGAVFDYQRVLAVNDGMKEIFSLKKEDVFIHIAPLFHAAQLNLFFTTAISQGSTSIIHSDFDVKNVMKDIEKYKVTVFFAVPAMYNSLIQENDGENDLSSIRLCSYGAAPMAPGLIKNAMTLFNTDQFYNLCGLTEAGPGGVYLKPEEHKERLGAGGKSMPSSQARVVTNDFQDIASDEVGEFLIKGKAVMKGYYNKPEETAKAFHGDWLLTGDLATIDKEGYITLVDRKKDMIISGGENIYSVEVEQVLNSYPDIVEAATIGVPDEKWGEIVVGILVVKEGIAMDESALNDFCRKNLAGYKIPKRYIYVDALPRNASGKILKYQLRKTI